MEFKIGNYYGTKEELKLLTDVAHKKNIRIIADLCLNFMAELEIAGKKEWDEADEKLLIKYKDILNRAYPPFNINDFKQRTYYNRTVHKKINNWYMGQLPALKTDTDKVQKVHFAYIKELVDVGIDGFRWDCAQWFKPEVIRKYLSYAKSLGAYNYLEIIERRNFNKIKLYNSICTITDYKLGNELTNIFKKNNRFWIKGARSLEDKIKILNQKNIVFAVNHDTYNCEQSRLFLNFEDNRDRSTEILATCMLLTIKNGVPLIFRETAKNSMVKDGVKFKTMMVNCNESSVLQTNSKDVTIIKRDEYGFAILNRGKRINRKLIVSGLSSGIYQQIGNQNKITVKNKEILGLNGLPRKSCLYFYKIKNINVPIFSGNDFSLLC